MKRVDLSFEVKLTAPLSAFTDKKNPNESTAPPPPPTNSRGTIGRGNRFPFRPLNQPTPKKREGPVLDLPSLLQQIKIFLIYTFSTFPKNRNKPHRLLKNPTLFYFFSFLGQAKTQPAVCICKSRRTKRLLWFLHFSFLFLLVCFLFDLRFLKYL